MNIGLFGWHFLCHRPQNNTSLNIPQWLPEKSVFLQLVMILTAYFPQLLPVIFLLFLQSLQWFSRVAWRHFNICSWCALMLFSCHRITTYFVTLFLLTVWYHLSVTRRCVKHVHFWFIVQWMMHDPFPQIPSLHTHKFNQCQIHDDLNIFLKKWELMNLTNPFQSPAASLGPDVTCGATCCYSKAMRVPPRELYVLFVKFYLKIFVSLKNKCCSHWHAGLAVVCTSQT